MRVALQVHKRRDRGKVAVGIDVRSIDAVVLLGEHKVLLEELTPQQIPSFIAYPWSAHQGLVVWGGVGGIELYKVDNEPASTGETVFACNSSELSSQCRVERD